MANAVSCPFAVLKAVDNDEVWFVYLNDIVAADVDGEVWNHIGLVYQCYNLSNNCHSVLWFTAFDFDGWGDDDDGDDAIVSRAAIQSQHLKLDHQFVSRFRSAVCIVAVTVPIDKYAPW